MFCAMSILFVFAWPNSKQIISKVQGMKLAFQLENEGISKQTAYGSNENYWEGESRFI